MTAGGCCTGAAATGTGAGAAAAAAGDLAKAQGQSKPTAALVTESHTA